MSRYVPKNNAVYLAAIPGALLTLDNAEAVNAFAQQFDQSWGADEYSQLDIECIGTTCLSYWQGRSPMKYPDALSPETYGSICDTLVTLARAMTAAVLARGIDPDAYQAVDSAEIIFDVTTPAALLLAQLPVDSVVKRVGVRITTPFDGIAKLQIGTAGNPDLIFGDDDIPMGLTVQVENVALERVLAHEQLKMILSLSGSTVGSGVLVYEINK